MPRTLPRRLVDGPVRVVDTETAAGAEGLVVLAAAVRAHGGVRRSTRSRPPRCTCASGCAWWPRVDSLDHLVRSGRVPGIAGRAGRGLGLNPLFEFRRGHPKPLRPALSRQAALDRMVAALLNSRVPGARLHVAALHAGAPEPAERLLEQVRAEIEPATAFLGSFSPVMVVHTGPGLVGLAWWWDEPAGVPLALSTSRRATGAGCTASAHCTAAQMTGMPGASNAWPMPGTRSMRRGSLAAA